ncbi:MAG TPA: efflux RND transporter permease subunit [Cyclobacteriaceae bacterium]|nr:efflux RND transporter permease subunit [Cyclobacteriaceae bacterium]
MLNKLIKFFLENKLVTGLIVLIFIGWGVATAPFNWKMENFPRDPVPVDAIPDIGENQQIVFTTWMGRSPQDIEDQISYPLTVALLGVPGVKTIRSSSIFGLSTIYIIFEDEIEFYWGRTRILEKLNSLPAGILPGEVQPALGPDATALGQIFWYTLEGRDPETGEPRGGWDPQELRTIQDFYVKYALNSAQGVSEVASIGGFVKEYQVDIDPVAMKEYNVNVAQIMKAVKESNLDVGARTMEFNSAEYLVRGLGYIRNLEDVEEAVVAQHNNTPIRVKDVAKVNFGPETRRGGLDKGGAEATGAVVVSRYGANPLEVIDNVKKKIEEVAPGLPSKVLPDGTVSKVTIVPFYDRSGLIKETLGTLEEALSHEILISIIVVIVLMMNIRASIIISTLLPIGVLMTFIVMKYFGVDANVVALSGIAIAIGVMVDVGVVFTENIVRHLEMEENHGAKGTKLLTIVYDASVEVASAIITALATTIISFLPVFAMQASEGKLFKPLAFTKTFALLSSLLLGLIVVPALAHVIFAIRFDKEKSKKIWALVTAGLGLAFLIIYGSIPAIALILFGVNNFFENKWPEKLRVWVNRLNTVIILLTVVYFLTGAWMPLGAQNGFFVNYLFVIIIVTTVLGSLMTIVHFYPVLLRWCLSHKWQFFLIPIFIFLFGITAMQGVDKIFGFIPNGLDFMGLNVRQTDTWEYLNKKFPGVGKEFMPPLDEGSYLLMPTTMSHSGIAENTDVIRKVDAFVAQIPEVESVVGKWGRVNSALDPAPISMFENTIVYKPEYMVNEDGHRLRFKTDREGNYVLKDGSKHHPGKDGFRNLSREELIIDDKGEYYRQWRDHIKSPDDIWLEIVKSTKVPGMTSAPKLQPIQTRLIMLSTGMRAPIGIKVFGPDLQTIESVGLQLEKILQQVPSIESSSVFADRIVGKPYLEFDVNRKAIARYGLSMKEFQNFIEVAIGGVKLTTTVEGRERFPVRVRYAREFRDNPDDVKNVLIPTPSGAQIPLGELAEVTYRRGPQIIKGEDTFLNGYVIFDKKIGYAEVDVVEEAQRFIQAKMDAGEFMLPAGVSYKFTGNYENQIRATKRLAIVVPISLLAIFLILYFQFGNVQTTLMVFTGIFVAFSGGFIMIWFYAQEWFLNFGIAGINMRDLFDMHTINLSVAVWVGFIALFGVATDDGVIMGTYIKQTFEREKPKDIAAVREAIMLAGQQRVRPAMMTAATTIIALIPVLTSTGKGSDIMVPMAIPSFGGMLFQVITMFIVPTLYCAWQEGVVKRQAKSEKNEIDV